MGGGSGNQVVARGKETKVFPLLLGGRSQSFRHLGRSLPRDISASAVSMAADARAG